MGGKQKDFGEKIWRNLGGGRPWKRTIRSLTSGGGRRGPKLGELKVPQPSKKRRNGEGGGVKVFLHETFQPSASFQKMKRLSVKLLVLK